MKILLLNAFGHKILEEYRYVDSLEWNFKETDSTYDVDFFLSMEKAERDGILQEYFHIIVIKKDCKATYYDYKYRYRNGLYERY